MNLNAIIDAVLHPDIPFFDEEHLLVGFIIGFAFFIALVHLNVYVRSLSKVNDKKDALIIELEEEKKKSLINEKKFKLLANNSQDLIFRMNFITGECEFVSSSCEKVTGYKTDVFYENPFFMLRIVHPDYDQYLKSKLEEVKKNELCEVLEYKIIDIDKKDRWLLQKNYFEKNDTGEVIAIEGIVSDITSYKNAEELIKASERKYRLLSENSTDGVSLIERDKLAYISPDHAKLLGFEEHEYEKITLEDIFALFHPEDFEKVTKIIEKANAEQIKKFTIDYRMYSKKGDLFWLEDTVNAEYDSIGVHLRSVVHSRNITDRKKIEQALKESEERYRFLSENTSDGIILLEKNVIKYISESYLKLLGYSKDEALNLTLEEIYTFMHEDDAPGVRKIVSKVEELKPNSYLISYRIRNKNGNYIWIEDTINRIYDENGNHIKTIVHSRNISERIQSELKLKESEERWKFALEGAGEGVWDWNLVTNEVFFSAQWKNMLGYKDQELPSNFEEWENRVHPDDLPASLNKINLHIEGVAPVYSCIYRILCKDGKYKWILDRGKIISYDKSGKPLRMIGTHADLTEQMEIEKKLEKLNFDKNRFISILAHDLKNPFNAILGFLDLLKRNIRKYNVDKIEEFINIVHNSSRLTYNMLDDLLSWSRAQAGNLPFEPQQLNVKFISGEIINGLKLNAENKNITINIEANENIFVLADKNMLNTILRNLITNAIKFTNSGGQINVLINEKDDFVTITVADDGVGITKEDIVKLFDITQIHSTPGTANEQGTGLGLVLCQELVNKNGGKIWVESELNIGSKFIFSIPKYQK